jgi:hypothetical protein
VTASRKRSRASEGHQETAAKLQAAEALLASRRADLTAHATIRPAFIARLLGTTSWKSWLNENGHLKAMYSAVEKPATELREKSSKQELELGRANTALSQLRNKVNVETQSVSQIEHRVAASGPLCGHGL